MTDEMDSSAKKDKLKLVKIPTTVYLEPAQAEALRQLSKITSVPQQVYLRRGVDMILREHVNVLGTSVA